ncbi:Scr1 family TA system antitoxin-like transcriptional regulator [Nocardiopsis sp. NPDC101807]|uniref:helix-turn-helix domain-containing protein n=1 Tax=Nocardiopsis sp. NPDC101807 TaxID=3364339 RepID=UPI0038031B0F
MEDERNPSDVRFGQALMRARKRAGIQQAVLARHLTCTPGHVSHIENGRRKLDESKVSDLDEFLEAKGRLVRTYEEVYQPEHVDWIGEFRQMQADAEMIREYQNSLVPGTIQHPEYAAATIAAGAPWLSPIEAKKRLQERMGWSKEVLRDGGPQYHVVLDDITVMRPIGPNQLMVKQITKIIELAETGRIMVQLHGWDQHPHAGLDGPFSLLTSSAAPDLVHVESVYRGQNTDDLKDVRRFMMLFSRLQATARSPLESVKVLKEMREKYGQP